MISIKGIDKATLLAALYNASHPLGLGFIHFDPVAMTHDEAEAILVQTADFDYLKGRVMKVALDGDEINPWGYDRDNGEGAVEAIVASLR